MSKDLNKVMATGHLGADPEMCYTPQGSAVTTFRIASGRSYKNGDGEKVEDTEWISCVAWEKLAEICNQYLTKGSRVYIEGRLQTRSWDDKDTGEKRYRTEVVLADMIILSSKQDREAPAETPAPAAPARNRAARPAAAGPAAAGPSSPPVRAPRRNVPQAIENDEDLPF